MKTRTTCLTLWTLGALWGNVEAMAERKSDMLELLDPSMVSVSGEIGRRVSLMVQENVHAIDYENVFLQHFRHRKEAPEVRDGFVGIGMLIDGLVTFAENEEDAELIALKDRLVRELIETQEDSGYIGIFTPSARKQKWDTHEGAYVIFGLVNDYLSFGNEAALDSARKLADSMIRSGDGYTCGFEQALLRLYRATGDRRYLEYCVEALGLPSFKGGSEGNSTHVYGYVARALAQLQLFEIDPDPHLLVRSKAAVENMVTFHAMDITGTMGSWEHWSNTQAGVGACGETCASAYSIRLLASLLRIEREAIYGDMIERIIYNALFAAQSPDGRRLRYFTPFEDVRSYYEDDYFCCPSNFRRIMAELPSLVYFRDRSGVFVNLYTASKAEIEIDGEALRIVQETDYPSSGSVKLRIEGEVAKGFSLHLRIPSWCGQASVRVNGRVAGPEPLRGRFLELHRLWQPGDEVELLLPMQPRFVSGKVTQYGRAALMRGPVVFCLNNELNGGLLDAAIRKQEIRIDPGTVSESDSDHAFRPNGWRLSAKAISIGGRAVEDTRLVFTEFIDPDGIKTYIDLPSELFGDYAADDEFLLKDSY